MPGELVRLLRSSCLNVTSLAHLPPFFRNDKIKLIYKRNIRMSGEYIFDESSMGILTIDLGAEFPKKILKSNTKCESSSQ